MGFWIPLWVMLHLRFRLASHLTLFPDDPPLCEWEDDWDDMPPIGGKNLATQRSPASLGVRR